VQTTSDPGPASTRRGRLLVLLTLSTTLFLIALDASVLNVALPELAAELRPDSTQLLWIVDAYSLSVAALLVPMAALGDRIGRRRTLRLGLTVLAAAALLAALSTGPTMLVAARALLGVGGAMAMPATLSILRASFPDDRERAAAVGVWSAVAAAGFVFGPLLGGALLGVASWQWIFWAQLPVAGLALLLTVRVPESSAPGVVGLDPAGVLLSASGMVLLVWSVKQVGDDGAGRPGPWLLLAAGVACLALFGAQQLRRERPMVDVGLFGSIRFSGATVAVLASNLVLAGPLLLLTQQLQVVEGLSPLEAGLRIVPIALAAVVAAPLTPRLVGTLGIHRAVGLAFLAVAGGLAVIAQVGAGTPYRVLLAGSLLLGAGAAVAASAASAALISAAPVDRAGNAAAVQETAYELGLTLGVSVLGSLALARYRDELRLPAGLDEAATAEVRDGLPQAVAAAGDRGDVLAAALAAFETSFTWALTAAAASAAVIAVLSALLLPRDRAATAVDHPPTPVS
jgi:DHA2 family multidrug resistance protein-like MFS transporter